MRTGDVLFDGRWIKLPLATTAERDAIVSPKKSYALYNTTTGYLEIFDGSVWAKSAGVQGATGLAGNTGAQGNPGQTGIQ